MSNLSQRKAPAQPRASRESSAPQLSDPQRQTLADVWTYLVAKAGEGKGISPDFNLRTFAFGLCYPRAGKHDTSKPTPYQTYAHDPALRPWTDAERLLVFLALSSNPSWNEDARTFTVKRPIDEWALQMGCSRSRVTDALRRHRDSPFPVLRVDSSPSFERDGKRHRGALVFSLIHEPLKFATARDAARKPRETAEDRKRTELHGERVRLQVARETARITEGEYRKQIRLLEKRIKSVSKTNLGALAVVESIAETAVASGATSAPLPPMGIPKPAGVELNAKGRPILKPSERRAAFDRIQSIYPRPDEDGSGRQRFMIEPFDSIEIDEIVSYITVRGALPHSLGGWADVARDAIPALRQFFAGYIWETEPLPGVPETAA